MDNAMLARLEAMREEALTPARVLDEAIVKLGGKSIFATQPSAANPLKFRFGLQKSGETGVRRMTQATAAMALLHEHGAPMTIHELMRALPSKGIILSGSSSQINFTSSLSKSGKFESVRRNGRYYWWFKDEPLPVDWQEAPDLLSKEGSGASDVGYQEGGEANATAT